MPKHKSKLQNANQSISINYIKQYANVNYVKRFLTSPDYLNIVCWCLILFEAFLNIFIIQNVGYTEIDWNAYMQEVEGFLNGTLDYKLLRGDTGPLVYPGGFVYIYSFLYFITSKGSNVALAQYLFLIIYIAQLYFVFKLYVKTSKLPPYALIISTLTSYRIHSIYVLRLFNDPIAVLLFYISLHLFLSNNWILGSIVYSLAVSVKMNILLYAPCLLIVYLTNLSFSETFLNISICGLVQLILGLPFLYTNPISYIKGSFDIGRVFEHKWTVNYRFLSRAIFENGLFHVSLLSLHVFLLLIFLPELKKYLTSYAKLNCINKDIQNGIKSKKEKNEQSKNTDIKQYNINFNKTAQLMVLPFFVTNLIGVACARSLHYQFYSWYFHSLIYLGFCTNYQKPVIFLLLAVIELCWNTYPSTILSSASLHVCHIILLYGVYKYMKN